MCLKINIGGLLQLKYPSFYLGIPGKLEVAIFSGID